MQTNSLFAANPEQQRSPSTILFPSVYKGPSPSKRRRPCTADSTLREVWERIHRPWLVAEGTAASTLSHYEMDLRRWEEVTSSPDFALGLFGPEGPPICEITRELLAEVRERLKARCQSINTANRMIRSINVILHRSSPAGPGNPNGEGLADEWLHLRPFPKTAARKRTATPAEIGEWYLRTEIATWPNRADIPAPLWWRSLLVLACTYGLRTRDLLDLRWEQVYWSEQCPDPDAAIRSPFGWLMLVPRKTQRKKPAPLILPQTRHVHAHLLTCWELAQKPTSGRVLKCPVGRRTRRTHSDGQASWNTVAAQLHAERARQQRRAGIVEPYTFQHLRKTAATWLGRVDRELRRLVLGHAARDVSDEYYFSGVGTMRDKLPLVPMPPAFDRIFSERGEAQRMLF